MNTSAENLYSQCHKVDILTENGATTSRNVLITLTKKYHPKNHLEVKLRDQNDFAFNFTALIDWIEFDKMKCEQHLEISYEEFHLQFIDLLKQTLVKEMLLKLEESKSGCKMVFYERSKIKALIFLIVDLLLTDQKDVINEMITNIWQLKESNTNTTFQLQTVKEQLKEKDVLLNKALVAHRRLEQKFIQDLKLVGNSFVENIGNVEKHILNRINNLSRQCLKLLNEINVVKNENKYRENVCSQTLFQLEQFKRDNERNYKVIDSLKAEIEVLSRQKGQNENTTLELRQNLTKKDEEIETLRKQTVELRKDIQEATVIIAQKTKTHNELARDLVQANTMLVNFNKQYDIVSKEVDHLKEVVKSKNEALTDQALHINCLRDEFDGYKKECNVEDLHSLRGELIKCRERIEELEKNNREAVKINGLLTKKLANGDNMVINARATQWMQPK